MEDNCIKFDPRLDVEFLQSIYEDDKEHALIFFSEFLKMAPTQMKEIEQNYCSDTVELFRQKIHKIKPVFSFVGLTELTAKAEILEKRCKEISHLVELNELYTEFKSYYRKTYPIIENEAIRLT
jgi:HPt (histidine-containing phosphotransfer) domain-containing protein